MFDVAGYKSFPTLWIDSYESTRQLQIPTGVVCSNGHIIARKAFADCDKIVVMGNQVVARLLATYRATREEVEYLERYSWNKGAPFNREGWERILTEFDGALPLKFRGLPDGTVVDPGVPLCSFEPTVDGMAWLTTYVQAWTQDVIWLMTATATRMFATRRLLQAALTETGDDPALARGLWLNFGDRSAGGRDRALMSGAAHGLVFDNTDCFEADRFVQFFYNTDKYYFNVAYATEHSTTTMHSDADTRNDFGGFRMAMDLYYAAVEACKTNPNALPLASGVNDTYSQKRWSNVFIPQAYNEICEVGGLFVDRPDSGDYVAMAGNNVEWLMDGLKREGHSDALRTTPKGFGLLPDNLKVLQGDGLDYFLLKNVLTDLKSRGLAISNCLFAGGSGTTNSQGRDDLSVTFKLAAAKDINRGWYDVFKDPEGAPEKRSLRGRNEAFVDADGVIFPDRLDTVPGFKRAAKAAFVDLSETGEQYYNESFDVARGLVEAAL